MRSGGAGSHACDVAARAKLLPQRAMTLVRPRGAAALGQIAKSMGGLTVRFDIEKRPALDGSGVT